MERLKKLKPLIAFHLLANSVVVLFITGASYYHVPLEGFKDHAIYLLHLCALQVTIAGFIYFLSLSKWLFRALFSVLFLIFCGFSFWAYSQDVSITPALIQGVMETKPDIAIDLITLPYVLFFLFSILALALLLWLHGRIAYRAEMKLMILPALACVLLYYGLERRQYGIFKFRLPYNVVAGVQEYFEQPPMLLNKDIPAVRCDTDSLKVVFVLGETLRADHLGLNGYERNTTELLSKRTQLISFGDLFTSKTVTATSVPQLLTDQKLTDEGGPYLSVYDLMKSAGYRTTWIGNQTLEKSFLPITQSNDEVILVDKYRSVFSFDKELDGVMLKPMDSVLKLNSKQVLTLHMIGSHWWYENRYEDRHRKYKPVVDSKYIPSLSREQLINSYDNTVVYLDFFLNEVIGRLDSEPTPTLMIYVSDHGELLGEEGKWLHAQDGDALRNPAFIIWFSESYEKRFPQKVASFRGMEKAAITTDTIFPSMLNLLDIEIVE
jgi:glucan phosphoethanolaminetransferase (alkaline phosphatase superfamily)